DTRKCYYYFRKVFSLYDLKTLTSIWPTNINQPSYRHYIQDIATDTLVYEVERPGDGYMNELKASAIPPDGDIIALSIKPHGENAAAWVYDTATGELVSQFDLQGTEQIDIFSNGEQLLSYSPQLLRVWN